MCGSSSDRMTDRVSDRSTLIDRERERETRGERAVTVSTLPDLLSEYSEETKARLGKHGRQPNDNRPIHIRGD